MAYNASSLDSFICYYLYLGFETLYLYLDDPKDATVGVASRYDPARVKIRVRDASLVKEWEATPSWSRLRLYAEREVQARQMLNCEHAIARCRAAGEHWLLHVDSDELLYLPGCLEELRQAASSPPASSSSAPAPGTALQRHLAELDRLGFILFTYRNLEAVPEALECDDMYLDVSLFKQHPSLVDEGGNKPEVNRACRYWYGAGDAGGELFRFYANGKSIIRVHDAMKECGSVHEWNVPSKEFAASATGTNNATLKGSQYVYHQLMRVEEMGGAVLLHFACCSFATFWKKKWADLGYASPNHRFRGGGGGLDQRANALALTDRRQEAESFYRRSMMVCDDEEKARQLSSGVCVRVAACEIVEAARGALLPRDGAGAIANETPRWSGAAVVTTLGAGASAPAWLSAESRRAVEGTLQAVRATACAAVAADAVMAGLVGQVVDEAERLAHAMAREAVQASSRTEPGASALASRGLPTPGIGGTDGGGIDVAGSDGGDAHGDAHGDGGDYYAKLFAALLPRVARGTLHLLPLDRLRFDLAAYWVHPMATALLEPRHVEALLHMGCVLLKGAFPLPMVRQAGLEAQGVPLALGASTIWAHERAAWILSPNEAPPRAPDPEDPELGPLPSDLFGLEQGVEPGAQPALCGAMRGLRGLAAALEEISELRLATPRAGLLSEVLGGGVQAHGPLNSGWPDTGHEVTCTLVVHHASAPEAVGGEGSSSAAATVSVTSHGKRRKLTPQPGDILLTLARQARVDVSACEAPSLWLTMPFYSSQLRTAQDGRMLGISKQAIRELTEKRNRGELKHIPIESCR